MSELPKINPNDVAVTAYNTHKSARVALRAPLTIDAVRETPELWARVQDELAKMLSRGDDVTLISPDGLTLAEGFVVVRALAGKVWLSKPRRLVALEPDALFSDGTNEVVAVGTQYGVREIRSGRTDGARYATAKAAEAEVLRRQPRKVL